MMLEIQWDLVVCKGKEIQILEIYILDVLNVLFHKIFSFFFFWLHHMGDKILVPGLGIEPVPLQWKHRVLTHWIARKSLKHILKLSSR